MVRGKTKKIKIKLKINKYINNDRLPLKAFFFSCLIIQIGQRRM